MNKKQVAVMWLGIATILIGSAFPYYYSSVFIIGPFSGGKIEPLGRHFIFTPPVIQPSQNRNKNIWIDLAPLHIEWTVISVVAIGLVVTFRGKEK